MFSCVRRFTSRFVAGSKNFLTSGNRRLNRRSIMGDSNANKQEIQTTINDLIAQDKVVIFSKTTCPYCYDAKEVFDKLGQKYTTIELNKHPQGNQVQEVLGNMTGARTVPRVFVDGKCIGGGSDTQSLYKAGSLQKMLGLSK